MQRSQNRAFRQPFGVNTCPYRIRGYRPYSGSGKSVLRCECPLRNYLLTVCRPMIFAKLALGPIRRTSRLGYERGQKPPTFRHRLHTILNSYSTTAAVTTCSPAIHPPRTDHQPRTRTGQPSRRGTFHRSNLPVLSPAPRLFDRTDYQRTFGPRSWDC